MKTLGIILLSLTAITAFAGPYDCDDYLLRHYKKDVVIKSITFKNKKQVGDIHYPHQVAKIKIKNIGQVDMNPISSDQGQYRDIWVKINGREYKSRFKIPLDSAQETFIYAMLKPRTLRHCSKYNLHLDTRLTAKQWGCAVLSNDAKTFQVREERKRCRFVRPRPIH